MPLDKITIAAESQAYMRTCTRAHETGLPMTINFCGDCGTTLYKTADGHGFRGVAILMAGTVDNLGEDMEVVEPQGEIWIGLRAKWVAAVKGAQQFEGFPSPPA